MMAELRAHVPPGARVLDVGGADVNGTYRKLFADAAEYKTLDFQGADIVVTDWVWPVEAQRGRFDAVLCGQMFEHDKFFWVTAENIARALKPGGIAIVIAPGAGAVHRHPVDCWRFYPDSMAAIAEWAGLELLGTKTDDTSPWRDIGGVFRKPG
jgi:SAM-dependent methyltransferase